MLSNRGTRFFVLYCLGFTFGIQYVYINNNVTIEEAWTTCHNVYNGSLADEISLNTSALIVHGDKNKRSDTYWHGVFEKTTNWITFEGCYDESVLDIKHKTNLTSIAQCQAECGDEPDTYFSVGDKICLCNDTTWKLTPTMNRSACNTDCGVGGSCDKNSTQVNIYNNVAVNATKRDNDKKLCLGFQCRHSTPIEFIAVDCNASLPYICGKHSEDKFHSSVGFAEFVKLCKDITGNQDFLSSSICYPVEHKQNHIRWTPVFRKKWYFQDTEDTTVDDLLTAIRITDVDRNRKKYVVCKTDTQEVSTTGSTGERQSSLVNTEACIGTTPKYTSEPESNHASTTPSIDWSNQNRSEVKSVSLIYGLLAGIVVLSALLIVFVVVCIKRQMLRSRRTKKKGAIENNSKTYVDVGVECSMEEFVNRNWFSDMKNKVERASLWEDKTKSRLSCSCNSEADDNTVALTNRFQLRSHTVHFENGFRMDMSSRNESVLRASTLSTIIDNHAFEYSEIDDPILLRYKTLASVHAEDDASDKAQADVTESDSTYFTLAMVAALTDKSRDQSTEVETCQRTSSTPLNTGFDQNLETEIAVLTTNDMHASELAIIQHQNENQNLESVGNENDAVYFVLEKQDD